MWCAWWSCDCSYSAVAAAVLASSWGVGFTLGVRGELEKHLLQAGAVSAAKLDEWDARLVGHAAYDLGVGVDAERVARLSGVVLGRGACAGDREGHVCGGQSGGELSVVAGADVGSRSGEQVLLGSGGDDAAVPDNNEV